MRQSKILPNIVQWVQWRVQCLAVLYTRSRYCSLWQKKQELSNSVAEEIGIYYLKTNANELPIRNEKPFLHIVSS